MFRSLVYLAHLLATVGLVAAQDQWSLGTADTVLRLTAKADQVSLTSLSAADGRLNWIRDPVGVSFPDHVFINTARQPLHWDFVREPGERTSNELTLKFVSHEPNLELLSIWHSEPGPGPIEHRLEIVNQSERVVEVPLVPTVNLILSAPAADLLENWWVEKGASRPSNAGTHCEPIGVGYKFMGRSTPYPETAQMIPWMSIQDTSAGAGVYFGIEFSGRVGFDVRAKEQPWKLRVIAGLDPSENGFRSQLPPGARFVTPTVFMGCYLGDVDHGANRLHHFVAAHLRPRAWDARYPLIVNNTWGSGMAVTEMAARRMIDDSALLGVELFHIDAGWFRGVGDWYPNPEKFPRGLAPLSDYAHSKGMLFGLWVGWTQGGTVARGSETLAVTNPKQRNWFTHDYPANWKPSDFTGATLCLGSAPAREWCLRELRRIVTSYKLDLLEHDQEIIVDECSRTDHGHTAQAGDVAYHAADGYYRIYDRLRKEFPRLLFEDCVNGGHTVDFGIVRRTHYISITDTYDPLSNRQAFYDASYPLPPSMCECYVENRPGPSLDTFKSMLRSGMMGWCTLMCDTTAWTVEQHRAARRQIQIYKNWLRPLINEGDLYHISPRPAAGRWDAMEYVSSKTGKGVIFVFRGAKSAETSYRVEPRGLDSSKSYNLWSEDGAVAPNRVEGSKLMKNGVVVRLNSPGTSDLVFLGLQ